MERDTIIKLIYLYENDIVKSQTMRKEIQILYSLLTSGIAWQSSPSTNEIDPGFDITSKTK